MMSRMPSRGSVLRDLWWSAVDDGWIEFICKLAYLCVGLYLLWDGAMQIKALFPAPYVKAFATLWLGYYFVSSSWRKDK